MPKDVMLFFYPNEYGNEGIVSVREKNEVSGTLMPPVYYKWSRLNRIGDKLGDLELTRIEKPSMSFIGGITKDYPAFDATQNLDGDILTVEDLVQYKENVRKIEEAAKEELKVKRRKEQEDREKEAEDARRRAEVAAKAKAEEEARLQAEEEARLKAQAETEAKRKAEAEARVRAAAEAEEARKNQRIKIIARLWADGRVRFFNEADAEKSLPDNKSVFWERALDNKIIIRCYDSNSAPKLSEKLKDNSPNPFQEFDYNITQGGFEEFLNLSKQLQSRLPDTFEADYRKQRLAANLPIGIKIKIEYFEGFLTVKLPDEEPKHFIWNKARSLLFSPTVNVLRALDNRREILSLDPPNDKPFHTDQFEIPADQYKQLLAGNWPLPPKKYTTVFEAAHDKRLLDMGITAPPPLQLIPKSSSPKRSSSSDSTPLLVVIDDTPKIRCFFYADRIVIFELPVSQRSNIFTYEWSLNKSKSKMVIDKGLPDGHLDSIRDNLADPFYEVDDIELSNHQLNALRAGKLQFEEIEYSGELKRKHEERERQLAMKVKADGDGPGSTPRTIAKALKRSRSVPGAVSISEEDEIDLTDDEADEMPVFDSRTADPFDPGIPALEFSASPGEPAPTIPPPPAPSAIGENSEFTRQEENIIVGLVRGRMMEAHDALSYNEKFQTLVAGTVSPDRKAIQITIPESITWKSGEPEVADSKPKIVFDEVKTMGGTTEIVPRTEKIRAETAIKVTSSKVTCDTLISKKGMQGMAAAFIAVYQLKKQKPPVYININSLKFPPDDDKLMSSEAWRNSEETLREYLTNLLITASNECEPKDRKLTKDNIRIHVSPSVDEIFRKGPVKALKGNGGSTAVPPTTDSPPVSAGPDLASGGGDELEVLDLSGAGRSTTRSSTTPLAPLARSTGAMPIPKADSREPSSLGSSLSSSTGSAGTSPFAASSSASSPPKLSGSTKTTITPRENEILSALFKKEVQLTEPNIKLKSELNIYEGEYQLKIITTGDSTACTNALHLLADYASLPKIVFDNLKNEKSRTFTKEEIGKIKAAAMDKFVQHNNRNSIDFKIYRLMETWLLFNNLMSTADDVSKNALTEFSRNDENSTIFKVIKGADPTTAVITLDDFSLIGLDDNYVKYMMHILHNIFKYKIKATCEFDLSSNTIRVPRADISRYLMSEAPAPPTVSPKR